MFPDILREVSGVPKQLYVLGEMPKGPCVTIVGTRKMTAYGEEVTYQLAGELAQSGITIIGSLAYCIYSVSHRAVLDAGGQTIATSPVVSIRFIQLDTASSPNASW